MTRLALHRRLSVKLAFVFALYFGGFVCFEGVITQFVLDRFGLGRRTSVAIEGDAGERRIGIHSFEVRTDGPPPQMESDERVLHESTASPVERPLARELLPEDLDVLNREELGALYAEVGRVARWTSAAVAVAGALLFGCLLARTVSRRIVRLVRWAAPKEHEGQAPPGITARDEIGLLANALQEAWQRNEQAQADLERRDRERRDWIAHVSHDLRTPLTALVSSLERGRELARTDGSSAAVLERFERAQSDARAVCDYAGDLLDLARLEVSETGPHDPLSPGELAKRSLDGLVPVAEAKRVDLRLRVEPDLPEVLGDGRLLQRVLQNLIENACRFASSEVALHVSANAPGVRFEVTDDGPGFGPDFEAVPERNGPGGLGLTFCKRVLESHTASLDVQRLSGGVTSVSFVLDVEPAREAREPAHDEPGARVAGAR